MSYKFNRKQKVTSNIIIQKTYKQEVKLDV